MWCALGRLVLDVILLAPRNLWWVLDLRKIFAPCAWEWRLLSTDTVPASLIVVLIHISDAMIDGGCWPHISNPLTLHFKGSYGGFCWSVSWSLFSACYVTRDVFPPGGVNTPVRGRRPAHPNNYLFCIVIQSRQLERILKIIGVPRCDMVSLGLEQLPGCCE